MQKEELEKQYDRFISQVREEARDLYWLYNFFFVIESALLGGVFIGKLLPQYLELAAIAGSILGVYWFLIVYKQRLWRNDWIKRIQSVETHLNIPTEFQMWSKEAKYSATLYDYIFGRRGRWRLLFCLPIGFVVVWVYLLTHVLH